MTENPLLCPELLFNIREICPENLQNCSELKCKWNMQKVFPSKCERNINSHHDAAYIQPASQPATLPLPQPPPPPPPLLPPAQPPPASHQPASQLITRRKRPHCWPAISSVTPPPACEGQQPDAGKWTKYVTEKSCDQIVGGTGSADQGRRDGGDLSAGGRRRACWYVVWRRERGWRGSCRVSLTHLFCTFL